MDPAIIDPFPAAPAPADPKTRARSAKHPLVSIDRIACPRRRRPCPKSAKCWAVRWREADGARKKHVHNQAYGEVEKLAVRQAIVLRDARARAEDRAFKAARDGHDPDAADERHTIDDACRRYYADLVKKGRSRNTLKNANKALLLFLQWTRARGVTHLDQISIELLEAYYEFLATRPLERRVSDGRTTYKVTAINQILKPLRTTLRREMAKNRIPHMSSDTLRECIPHVPCRTEAAREALDVESARPLSARKVRLILTAALRRDEDMRASGWPKPPCAVDVSLLLLLGVRRDEYTQLKCGAVKRSKRKGVLVRVLGKGRRRRRVRMRRYTDAGIGTRILLTQIAGRKRNEWLAHNTYEQLHAAIVELHARYGAPAFSSHDLRATCATKQLRVAGINPVRAAYRLGHSLAENLDTYVDPDADADDLDDDAESLEHAMRARKLFRAVLRAMAAHPRAARPSTDGVTKVTTRVRNIGRNDHALLAKGADADRLLADTIARMPPLVLTA